ncbi:hypothetical protein [Glutamicibacter protophormiae]|uniref:hypothetical protein n=1 Tax=Glutamicibacter protophormiae TaxID=37930 RepID=UPI003A8D9BE7
MEEIEIGMTCRLGKSKTSVEWEVVAVLPDMERVHVSKLGGDGYVNKSVAPADMRDVQPRKLPVCLAHVLDWQTKVRNLAATVQDRARFFDSVAEVSTLSRQAANAADAFEKSAAGYYKGIAAHYPHLVKEA